MAANDIHVRLCLQEIVKLDLEVKALIQVDLFWQFKQRRIAGLPILERKVQIFEDTNNHILLIIMKDFNFVQTIDSYM